MKRAISVEHLLAKKFTEIPLTGRFRELIGIPEATGTWFIKGESGHGKTSFLMQLSKELSKFGDVLYNSLEEGARKSMQDAVKSEQMYLLRKGSFQLLHKEPMPELITRLKRKRSPVVN